MEELIQFADYDVSGLFSACGLPNFHYALNDITMWIYALPVLVLSVFAVRYFLWAVLSCALGNEGAKLVSLIIMLFAVVITSATVQTDTVIAYAAGIMRGLIS